MKTICCVCQKTLSIKPGGGDGQADQVSHGICKDCLFRYDAQEGVSLKSYIENLPVPTVSVDANGSILMGNVQAMSMLEKNHEEISAKPGGEVFECEHSILPEGCGGTVHCSGCTIRNTVMKTMESGQKQENVPAFLNRSINGKRDSIDLLISTEKFGEIVVLRIEKIAVNSVPD